MLSRVADSIYWMARFVERAENVARFIEVTLQLSLDLPGGMGPQWAPLVSATGDSDYFSTHYGTPTAERVIRFLAFDRDYPHSIMSCLRSARENARTIRDAISTEAWEQLNDFYHHVHDTTQRDPTLDLLTDYFRSIRLASHLFQGVLDATMLRGPGWHFANLGRMLERADKTSRILDVKYFTLLPTADDVGTAIDDLHWSAVLRSVSGLEMYRKRYHAVTVQRVVEFLILDPYFPRAIHFAINSAEESLRVISGSAERSFRNLAEQRLGRLRAELVQSTVDQIVQRGVHEFVDHLQSSLNAIDTAIYETFFPMGGAAESTQRGP